MHLRRRIALAAALALALVALVAVLSGGGSGRLPGLPAASNAVQRSGDPFGYDSSRESQFVARAIAGNAHVLFTKSPGGVVATAARVSRFRRLIDAAGGGSGIDPDLLEGIVFLESAGRPDVIAGGDPVGAAGLTQIVASTGQALLGMHIDLARSRTLTSAIAHASVHGQQATVKRLQAQRARIDERFVPRRALQATIRYLKIAESRFGRLDLAIESYHMGIGNLAQVLRDYDGGAPVPYAQLFFDTFPNRHPSAYSLLSGFGDDSWLYWWRVQAAVQIMRLFRSNPGALRTLVNEQTATDSAAEVLHPPQQAPPFSDPRALDLAYARHQIVPLPANPRTLGMAYSAGIGSLARRLSVTPRLYRGLRPAAAALLVELAARVRRLSGGLAPLIVTSAVSDMRYQQLLGISDPTAAAGWSFTIARHYVSRRQAAAFQAMLDRLQGLNLIAWQRFPAQIEVTVSSDAGRVIAAGV